jgi:hypothetical protein
MGCRPARKKWGIEALLEWGATASPIHCIAASCAVFDGVLDEGVHQQEWPHPVGGPVADLDRRIEPILSGSVSRGRAFLDGQMLVALEKPTVRGEGRRKP